MILTMLFTYTKCVENEHCPALPRLPTISNTWVDPPGNFLSRFVIGNVCFCFGMLQFILWRPELPNFKHASLFMALGIFSVFCLSVVGAICDSASDKECRGNFTIHILCASTFFVLYNMNMILLTSKGGRWKAPSLLLPVLLSTMCKARWLFSHSEALAPPDLTLPAIIEWSDVFLIVLWTARFVVMHRSQYSFGLVLSEDSKAASSQLLFVPATTMTLVTAIYYFGTLFISLFFIYHQHRVEPGSLPYISDTWVYPPGNWISRWAIVQGGILMLWVHVCVYSLDGGTSASDKAITAVALIAILGLDIVGCVNEKEDHPLHIFGATFYFGGYDLYMVLRTLKLARSSVTETYQLAILTFLTVTSCVLTWMRFIGLESCLLDDGSFYGMPHNVIAPILEWTDACAIALYAFLSVAMYGKAGAKLGLSLVAPPATPTSSADQL